MEIGIRISATMPLCFHTHLGVVLFEEIDGNMTNDSEIFSTVIFSDAAIVFMECDI